VTAVSFAKRGFKVVGIDRDRQKLEHIRKLKAPFFEPGLDSDLQKVSKKGTLTVTDTVCEIGQSDMVYMTVGTPSRRNGSVDLSQVRSAATTIGHALQESKRFPTVVVKSTVAPGTASRVIKPIIERESKKSAGLDFGLVSNPEFLREGNGLHDSEFPDRIIMGADNDKTMDRLEMLYRKFHGADIPPIIRTTHENAELIKYAGNAFLATKISFINTIATIAEHVPGADVSTVARSIGLDSRIGSAFLNAGLGYGGSCFPKDVKALNHFSRALGYAPRLLEATSEVNSKQAGKVVHFAKRALGSIRRKKVAVLGLSFKPETDDTREAVSFVIIKRLHRMGVQITVYDPVAVGATKKVFGSQIKYAHSAKHCITKADLAILVTEWDEFRRLTPHDFTSLMRTPIVFDGRRIYDPKDMQKAGMRFAAIGLGPTRS
jgi:UDPglucose 6-dehydrogenase